MKPHHSKDACLSHQLSRLSIRTLARESGWSRRDRGKVSPEAFCLAMMISTNVAAASLRIVAFISGAIASISVSKQAIHKRINQKALAFLSSVLNAAISSRLPGGQRASKAGLRRIVVQDSTTLALPSRLFGSFPGSGNERRIRAGMKIHAAFEPIGRSFLGFDIREARTPDQAFALEGARGLGQGDLLLRDLGYFSVPAFRAILAAGIEVLSRFKLDVSLRHPETLDTVDLLAELRSRSSLDMPVLAGRKELLPMRLVAFRLPKEVGQARRRAFRRTARRKGRAPSRLSLQLQDWQIYLTSCKPEDLDCEQVRELYRQRWSIEILFKAFKTHMRIDQVPPFASETMLRCLILSTLLRITLAHTTLLPALLRFDDDLEISDLKLLSVCEALCCLDCNISANGTSLIENILRHCRYDKRKRMSLPQKLEALG